MGKDSSKCEKVLCCFDVESLLVSLFACAVLGNLPGCG